MNWCRIRPLLDTPFMERFAATGIALRDVDWVFCTHLHGDHYRTGLWKALRDGALLRRGMPPFDSLDEEQAGQLYAYIRARAREALATENPNPQAPTSSGE